MGWLCHVEAGEKRHHLHRPHRHRRCHCLAQSLFVMGLVPIGGTLACHCPASPADHLLPLHLPACICAASHGMWRMARTVIGRWEALFAGNIRLSDNLFDSSLSPHLLKLQPQPHLAQRCMSDGDTRKSEPCFVIVFRICQIRGIRMRTSGG